MPKRLRTDDRQALEGAEREQVLIARDERIGLAVDGAGDDHVIVRVAYHAAEWPGAEMPRPLYRRELASSLASLLPFLKLFGIEDISYPLFLLVGTRPWLWACIPDAGARSSKIFEPSFATL